MHRFDVMVSRPRGRMYDILNRRLDKALQSLHYKFQAAQAQVMLLAAAAATAGGRAGLGWAVNAVSYPPSQTEHHPLSWHFFSFPMPRSNYACSLAGVWWACCRQDGSSGEERWRGRVGCFMKGGCSTAVSGCPHRGTWTFVCAQAAASPRDSRRDPEIYIQFQQASLPDCPFWGKYLE